MIIIPAIDLKDGKCVRLRQGRMNEETVYSDEPVAMARKWAEGGGELIHIVDLDGALEGRPLNLSAIEDIVGAIDVPVEIGGGIRDFSSAETYLRMDAVKRVILGTVALDDKDLVRTLAEAYPGRIAVGIDAKDGLVAVRGWVDVSERSAKSLAMEFEGMGVASIIYTDISRDGMLSGPNIEATVELAASIDIPVIASGGMSKVGDVTAYKEAAREGGVELEGVIIGKALYTGDIELREAVEAARGA